MQVETAMNVIEIQAAVIIGIIVILGLVIFRKWFFGEKEIDSSKGFPYSRDKQKKK
jgi:hypothetical protein